MNFSGNLPFNWFDLFVVIMIFAGYVRGRKNGMSQETLPSIKWLVLLLICAISYEPLGTLFADLLHVGKLFGYLLAYATVAGIITLLFVLLSRTLGEKLKGSDTFGKGEFYLAMPAGMLRFTCIVLVILAVLNARYYTTSEVRAAQKYQNDNYGSNFFPSLYAVQDDVFIRSMIGKQVKEHLSFLLIKPTSPVGSATATTAAARRRK